MKKGYRKKLLKYEIFIFFVLVAVILDLAIVGISYAMYTNNINSESEKICTGLSEAIASSINGNRIDDWLSGERLNDYAEGEEQLKNILNSYSDIINIHVYKMNLDGPRVVYDLSRTRDKTELLGKTLQYGERLSSIKSRLISGEYVGTVFSEENKETVITSMTPVTDVTNKVTCYAICEIGMKTMKNNREELIKTLFPAILIASVILVTLLNVYVNYSIVNPINKLDFELRKMTGYNKADEVMEQLQKLKKHRLSEVTYITDGFIDILSDISQKNMEAEAFEAHAKKRMFRAIKKEDDDGTSHEKQKTKVVARKKDNTVITVPKKRIVKAVKKIKDEEQ